MSAQPLEKPTTATEAASASREPQSTAQPQERILFVDDEPDILRAFQRTLSRTQYAVDVASDAWSAMKLAKRNTYAVIATDYMMPGLNGFDVADELRHLQPDATYILISGNCDLGLTLDAVNEHSLSFVIPKPWSADGLITTLNRAFELYWEKSTSRKISQTLARMMQRRDRTPMQAANGSNEER